MNKKILVVVDMQNDFITGSLGTPEAVSIVDKVVEKIEEYKKQSCLIITTQDTHYSDYLDTLEGKKLPIKHCIANSDGWQIEQKVYNALRGYKNKINFTKNTFGCYKVIDYLNNYIKTDDCLEYEFELIGLDLDICVLSNALLIKTYFPNNNISIDLKCVAATNNNMFEAAKHVLDSCQVTVYE